MLKHKRCEKFKQIFMYKLNKCLLQLVAQRPCCLLRVKIFNLIFIPTQFFFSLCIMLDVEEEF